MRQLLSSVSSIIQSSLESSPVLCSIFVVLISFFWWTWPYKLDSKLPGPPSYLYVGAMFTVLHNYWRLPDWIAEGTGKYGGGSWGGQMPGIGLLRGAMISVTTPENVKYILKDNFSNYEKGAAVRAGLFELLGDGIFTADGPTWKFHRKVASHMFSARLMRESTFVAARYTKRLMEVLRNKALPPSAIEGDQGDNQNLQQNKEAHCQVDMQDMYFRLTIDIFTFIAFGEDLKSLEQEQQHAFALAFDEVQRLSERRFFNPVWRLCKLLRLTASERKIARGRIIIDEFAQEIIKSRRRDVVTASAVVSNTNGDADEIASKLGPDLLTRFLQDAAKKRNASGEQQGASAASAQLDEEAHTGGSDKELRDIVLNFMIAGRDTTACALSWTLFEIARGPPEVRDRLRAEFEEVFDVPPRPPVTSDGGGVSIDGSSESRAAFMAAVVHVEKQINFEKVGSMKYAHAVAQEVLRLHPSVPKDVKFAVKRDVLPDGTNVPPGCSIIYSPYAMGRDKRLWGADALEFKPERFLNKKEPDVYKYTTFNAGPRLCLGKPLAMMEIKLVTAMLLMCFDVELAVPHEGGYLTSIVLPMHPGLAIKLTPRR